MGGTVAAACAAWEEYARRYPNNVDKTMTNSMAMLQNENNMHLCWAGNYYPFTQRCRMTKFAMLIRVHPVTLADRSACSWGDPSRFQGLWRGILHILR